MILQCPLLGVPFSLHVNYVRKQSNSSGVKRLVLVNVTTQTAEIYQALNDIEQHSENTPWLAKIHILACIC